MLKFWMNFEKNFFNDLKIIKKMAFFSIFFNDLKIIKKTAFFSKKFFLTNNSNISFF